MSSSATVFAKAISAARTCSVSAARSIGGGGSSFFGLAAFGFALWASTSTASAASDAVAITATARMGSVRVLMRMASRKKRAVSGFPFLPIAVRRP